MNNKIENQVRLIIHEELNLPMKNINTTSHFVDDLGADSFDTVNIIASINSQFKITISNAEAATLDTVAELIEHIKETVNNKKKKN